jgi:hypothetical protein
MTWTGWAWQDGNWVRVCVGESIGAVSRQLSALLPDVETWRTCITGGGAPNYHPAGRERVRGT